MVSGSLALLYFLLGCHGGRQGSGPDRGQSPVEWGDFLFIHLFVHLFVMKLKLCRSTQFSELTFECLFLNSFLQIRLNWHPCWRRL